MVSPVRFRALDLLTLHEIRAFIRNSSARGGVVFFGLLYVLGSVLAGGMLVLASIPGPTTWTVLWSGGPGSSPWNYPGLVVVAPWGIVSLPFFPTFAMLVVAVGVGLGMTVAFLLSVRLLRRRTPGPAGSNAIGTVAGLTPAMISLVTLGACCSTTAAATAGVGLVAQASGTSATNLLLNNWYLGVFQIAVVWVALIAQEMLLVIYAGLFGQPAAPSTVTAPRPWDARVAVGALVRVALLIGAILWSLSMVEEWTVVAPSTAGPGVWVQWILQHQVVAGLAMAAALFPTGTLRLLRRARERWGVTIPALFLLAGASLIYAPPPLAGWGLDGLVNQMLFTLGAPAAWGALSPGPLGGLALAARWGLEYALLAGSAIGWAVAPDRVASILRGAPDHAPSYGVLPQSHGREGANTEATVGPATP